MNYEQNIKYSYDDLPLTGRGEAVIFLANSSSYIFVDDFQTQLENEGYTSPRYDELLMFASQYAREENAQHKMLGLLYHPYYSDYWDNSALFVASEIDFAMIGSDHSGISIYNADMSNSDYDAFFVYEEPRVYPTYNYSEEFSSFSYDNYEANIVSGDKVIFDYSSLSNNRYSSQNYREFVNRDNQIAYNYTFLSIHSSSPSGEADGMYFDFGSPINDLRQSGYDYGYNTGYQTGYTTGLSDGYTTGVNSGGLIEQTPATAFTYIGTAFNAVGNILNIEILPNITLGLCFSIPIVFVLIMTLFRLVKK